MTSKQLPVNFKNWRINCFFIITLSISSLESFAQPLLPSSVNVGTGFYEYIIPNNIGSILCRVSGGVGGTSTGDGCFFFRGGKAAVIEATFNVSNNCPGVDLQPGGTVRLIVGAMGEGSGFYGAGGGGGSAFIYRAPSSNTWEILLVAGGGGGNVVNFIQNCYPGGDAMLTNNGGDGFGNNFGAGGTNGGGGGSNSFIAFGGGGAFSAGQGISTECVGKAGGSTGGQPGNCGFERSLKGGFGFGGGGASGYTGGGGGGGYSGGGSGGDYGSGGGGGSYLSPRGFNTFKNLSLTGNGIGIINTGGLVQPRIYVDKTAVLNETDGSSWNKAFRSVQDAIAVAKPFCRSEIWVAKGTYYPDEGVGRTNNSRGETFTLPSGCKIYGGFDGTETLLSQRNLLANTTILSGEIQQDNISTNNTFNVVSGAVLDNNCVLDGFTITGGYAIGAIGNAINNGGGLVLNQATPIINNCTFQNNTALNGGAIICFNSSAPRFNNCLIVNNANTGNGGPVFISLSSPSFYHCTMANNTVANTDRTVISIFGSGETTIVNSIIWGYTPAITGGSLNIFNSITQTTAPLPGVANSNSDPQFVNTALGNFKLKPCSPGINTGDLAYFLTTDILGQPRVAPDKPDMGAYEMQLPDYTLFVNKNAVGSGDGTNWQNAFTSLQQAISSSISCIGYKQIWVAAGTYYPDEGPGLTNNDRNLFFRLLNGIVIYGGFAGTESLLSQRNLAINTTILSGEIQQDNNIANNSNGIFRNTGLNNTAVLDGCTITAGSADGNGGAMQNNTSSPILRNCIFSGNKAASWAGAIYNTSSNPEIVNTVFYNNSALNGGAVFNSGSSPFFNHCTFSGNVAPSGGGAVWSQATSLPVYTNCVIWGNSTGQLTFTGTSPNTVNYSLVQGGFDGTSNLNLDPLFVNAATGNLRLQNCSPAINKGTLAGAPATDILGLPRVVEALPDMGAYELPNPVVELLAPDGGSVTQTIQPSVNIFYNSPCEVLARISPSGINPIAGSVTARSFVQATKFNFNEWRFLRRSYELLPANNTHTATGTVTVYFSQEDFNDFNVGASAPLPKNPTDLVGMKNLRIVFFSGTSANGAAAGYSNPPIDLDPIDANVTWESYDQRWAVTFTSRGFGGYFVTGSTTLKICPGAAVNLVGSSTTVTNPQWIMDGQILTEGFPFTGTKTNNLTIASQTSLYGKTFVCFLGSTVSQTYTLQYRSLWSGGIGTTNWQTAGNWAEGCTVSPDQHTDVLVPRNAINFPVVGAPAQVRTLKVNPAARVNVAPGITLTVIK